MRKILLLTAVLIASAATSNAQFLMDMLDTTKEAGKGLLNIYRKYDHLRLSGYIQPQFQVTQTDGARSFEGGDFNPHVSNRFMLRRSRIRVDYLHLDNANNPGVQFVFQFDANERALTVRDVWGRVFENKFKLFSFTIGLFARPFSYEVNLASADRETPERGRMSQTLMKGERDLGAMVSFEVRKEKHPLKYIKIDAGFFNGQGINAAADFDNRKDFIGRISLKPVTLGKKIIFTAAASYLNGGLLQNTKYVYSTKANNGAKTFIIDSASDNQGKISPRIYKGADAQIKVQNDFGGFTELRAEYIYGTQTATAFSSETPNALMNGADGFYRRNFNGAYFYFLQHIVSVKHQLAIKYDWYDPNTRVTGTDIGKAGTNLNAADVKYSTLTIGYNYLVTPVVRLSLFYSIVKNEHTQLAGLTSDAKDNVFTGRLQFRF